jgi:hypothetical protein
MVLSLAAIALKSTSQMPQPMHPMLMNTIKITKEIKELPASVKSSGVITPYPAIKESIRTLKLYINPSFIPSSTLRASEEKGLIQKM